MLLPSRKYIVFQEIQIQVPPQKKRDKTRISLLHKKTNEIINISKTTKNTPFDSDTNIPAKLKKQKNETAKGTPNTPLGPPQDPLREPPETLRSSTLPLWAQFKPRLLLRFQLAGPHSTGGGGESPAGRPQYIRRPPAGRV